MPRREVLRAVDRLVVEDDDCAGSDREQAEGLKQLMRLKADAFGCRGASRLKQQDAVEECHDAGRLQERMRGLSA